MNQFAKNQLKNDWLLPITKHNMGFHKNIDELFEEIVRTKSLFTKIDLDKIRETVHYLHDLSWEKKGLKLAERMRPVQFTIEKDGSIKIIKDKKNDIY